MLALIPVRDGTLPAGSLEVAAECGGRSLLVGERVADTAEQLSGVVQLAEVGVYRPGAWAAALADALAHEPVIVLPASPDGRDLGPRLAAALDRPYFAGTTQVSYESVVVARGGGRSMHTMSAPAAFVATLQVGVRGTEPVDQPTTATDCSLEVTGSAIDGLLDAEVLDVLAPDAATVDLAEAGRIVGGGAGLRSTDQFDQLAALGDHLGASVGATRVITDRGWVGHERQIGTTGVVVDPDLYLAFGISGAVQHTSGLGHPDHIISVNTDAHCPMMQLADLALVADANEVLAELVRMFDGVVAGSGGAVRPGADEVTTSG